MILSLVILVTWTPKVCKIMAFLAIIPGLGLLFYILLGFRLKLCFAIGMDPYVNPFEGEGLPVLRHRKFECQDLNPKPTSRTSQQK